MNKLVPSQPKTIQLPGLSNDTINHLQRIETTALVAKVGLEELSEIYTYGEHKAINSLVTADLYRKTFEQSGGQLTAEEEASYTALRRQYLEQVRAISEIAGSQVVRTIAQSPRTHSRSLLERLRGE